MVTPFTAQSYLGAPAILLHFRPPRLALRYWTTRGDTAMKVLESALVLAAALAALGPAEAEAEILIGAAAQLTGDYSWLGEQVERGAEMAVDDINKAGGVLGTSVRLILADDYCRGD
jgi:ABC-type branched-subunit amino acid transport system substrate-binding protein